MSKFKAFSIHGTISLNGNPVGAYTTEDDAIRVIIVTAEMGATGLKTLTAWIRFKSELENVGYLFNDINPRFAL